MRILWVKVGGLWPLTAGGRLRSFHTVRALAASHQVTVLTTPAPEDDPAELSRALPECEVVSFAHAAPKQGTLAFGLGLLTVMGLVQLWHVYVFALLLEQRAPALEAQQEGLELLLFIAR